MHLPQLSEVILYLHVLVGARSRHYADHIGHYLGQRYLEGEWLDMRIDDIQIDLAEHFKLVPLPQDGAPIVFSDQSYQM